MIHIKIPRFGLVPATLLGTSTIFSGKLVHHMLLHRMMTDEGVIALNLLPRIQQIVHVGGVVVFRPCVPALAQPKGGDGQIHFSNKGVCSKESSFNLKNRRRQLTTFSLHDRHRGKQYAGAGLHQQHFSSTGDRQSTSVTLLVKMVSH